MTSPLPLHAITREVQLTGGLLDLLPSLEPSGVWIREGSGMIGLGVAAQASARGPRRFADLARWFESLEFTRQEPDPLISATRTGPVAFTSITCSSSSAALSQLVVPEVLIVTDTTLGRAWLTAVTDYPVTEAPLVEILRRHGLELRDDVLVATGAPQPAEPPHTTLTAGTHEEQHFLDAVSAGVEAIHQRRLEKLVLARDVLVQAQEPIRAAPLLSRLAQDYAGCWTYLAGDVLGATPEMLVRVRGQEVSARVLAGTLDRSLSPAQARTTLLGDSKQRNEHWLAVESLLEQLGPVAELNAPQQPSMLELPNVYHLSTDVTGRLIPDGSRLPSPLLVAERAHPTAAICGTPTSTAAELIPQLEELDRGPYAGPVGWIDTRGNADFGIALRGGVWEDARRRIRLYAGCGVVAGSDPESELAETRAKLTPMLTSLGVQ